MTIAGRLLRVHEADTSALAGLWVIAHQVGERRQGPVDSMRTDAGGRFRFVVRRPDSGAVFVVSARYQGIGYFSEPMQNGAGATSLIVFDTTATGPPLALGIRHLVVTQGDAGQRRVLDIYQVQNPGLATRVGRDSTAPVWSTRLPDGITAPQPGESDIPATAIHFEGGRVSVSAPFPPGLKQVVITYDLPAALRTLAVPVDQPTERLEVLVEDSTTTVSRDLTSADPVVIENRTFRRYSADSLAAGARPTLTFGAAPADARRYVWIAIVAAALALAAGGALIVRRAGQRAAPPAGTGSVPAGEATFLDAESDERLLAQIAALDDLFSGREGETDPERWASYQRRRVELKAALTRRVARA